ncbi:MULTISPECIES: hypothetical protein [unclassified Micromonospora]|uniref:hypothetical protein n=1 Tax=unclassified Micromonospora TaxID=2617518 RepID=UPI002FEFFD89
MRFHHVAAVRAAHPTLVAGVLTADGITAGVGADDRVADFTGRARQRLAGGAESGFPEIRAWRRAFAAMGLPPTRYRCAAESLLRRFRRDGELPGCTRWSTSATRSRWRTRSRSRCWT